MEKEFRVRDLRKKNQFIVDDEYLNGYARLVSPWATLSYLSLCRHADNRQISFPSYAKIAEEYGISTDSVQKGIRELIKIGIVRKKRMGKRLCNEYLLADKSMWENKDNFPLYHNKRRFTKKSDTDDTAITLEEGDAVNTGEVMPLIQVSDAVNTGIKDTHVRIHIEGDTLKGSKPASEPVAGQQVQEVKIDLNNDFFPLFEPLNPTYERLFANRTERAALERLIKKFGPAGVKSMLERLPQIVSMPYAPKVTKPTELESKMGDIQQFLAQEKSKAANKKIGLII